MSTPMSTPARKRVPSAVICASRRLEVLLLHLEVGDAVAQQAADAVVALEHGDRVAGARELLRGGEAGGAGADDGDRLAGQAPGRLRLHPAVAERLVDDRDLDLLDRHGGLVDAEHARRLARRRAEPPRELGEVVRGVQALDRRAALAAPHEVVPLGDQVAERAALVAERDAAVHAATGLAAQLGGVALLVDLFPVHDAHRHGPPLGQLALGDLQKALRVSHPSPPGSRRPDDVAVGVETPRVDAPRGRLLVDGALLRAPPRSRAAAPW